MEAERGGVTPFWVEINQDFRRHRRHNRRNIRIPDGVFAFFLSPLALIPTVVVVAVLLSYIPTFLSPLSQFLRRVLLFKSWEAFNLLLVLFAILTGIFSRNTNAGGHHLHHQEGEPFAANFDFPGKSEDRNGHDEVGGSRIIFHRSDPLRNEETYPAAVQEEAPVSLDLKAAWFPDGGRKTERFGSERNLISPDAHFQRDAGFGKRNMRSPCSSSADSPPKTSNVDRGSLIQTWRSLSSLHPPPPPLENIDAEDGFVVPRRRSPPPRLPPLGSVNVEGRSNIRSKHFPPPLLSHPPETINADDGADVLRKHSRPHYHPLETMNSDDGCVIQTMHSSPPLKSLSQPALPHSAHSHPLEAPESKTKRRSEHRSKDAPSGQGDASSPPLAPSSSSKKDKKKKEKEKRKEKKKSRGTEPTAEIPVPPSLPPPPPSSFFHQCFADLKNETKLEKLRPHSDRFLPPLPPSSLPLHLGTTREASSAIKKRENAGKENVGSRESSNPRPFLPPLIKEKQRLQIEVRSSSSDSSSGRSIPYLPPPPPQPFAVAEESKVKGSKYVQTRRESRRVYEGLNEQSRGEERSGNSLLCPSPDVNVKADKFIARFHEGIRLEKLQSTKEKLVREGIGAKSHQGTISPGGWVTYCILEAERSKNVSLYCLRLLAGKKECQQWWPYVITPTSSANNGGQDDDNHSSGYVLSVSDAGDLMSKKECHAPSPSPGGLLRPDKAVHLIPLVIFFCAFILWFFSSPPDATLVYRAKSLTGPSDPEITMEEPANRTNTVDMDAQIVDSSEQEKLGRRAWTKFSFINGRKVEHGQPEIGENMKDEGSGLVGSDRLRVGAVRRNELDGFREVGDSGAGKD